MKISLEWLSDFVELTEKNPQKIADRITTAMGEVDDLMVQGKFLDGVVVGEITSIGKHPDPKVDRLAVCDVKTDVGLKHVVCGGTNLKVGMKVAFAHVGATVKWHGGEIVTLEKTKIRGEESEGMVCAAEELELAEMFPPKQDDGPRPVIDLGDRNDVGTPLKKALGMHDVVLHIDNHAITHRADLFSHRGVAREFVALGLAKWKKGVDFTTLPKVKFPGTPVPVKFELDIPKLVPKYAACVIAIDGLGETPDWMKRRLAAGGFRSVSLPVDITNYVALEVGMPLHAFDMDDLKGTVHMDLSKKGDTITTLDGVNRELPEGAIIMRDDEGIFDLMGIMGGLRSSTKSTTKRIYLHSASVDAASIRRAMIATGHRTDAGTVYEKGIPTCVVELGMLRAVELMLELVPGAKVVSKTVAWGKEPEKRTISITHSAIERHLGHTFKQKEVETILGDLDFAVKAKKGKDVTYTVIVPAHRLGDMRTPFDLTEEVGRVYGYDKIPATMPAGDLTPPARDHRIKKLRCALRENGFTEILPLSLTGMTALEKSGVDTAKVLTIENPLGEELGALHPHTLPALLEHAERNLALIDGPLKTFHWGTVFAKNLPEHKELTVLWTPPRGGSIDMRTSPLLQTKAVLQHVFSRIGAPIDVRETRDAESVAHPGRIGSMVIHDTTVGTLYEVHPDILKRYGLPTRTAAATINLSAILAMATEVTVPTPLPQFPAVTYDETVDVRSSQSVGPLLTHLKENHPLLVNIAVVNLYQAREEKTSYKLTVRCTYRAADRTLTEDEAKKTHAEILRSLQQLTTA